MKSNTFITLKKELRGILRDKKYLTIILLYPFIIPVYVILMGYFYDSMFNGGYEIGTNYILNNVEESIVKNINDEYKVEFIGGKSEEELKKLYNAGEIDAYIIKEDKEYTLYVDESSTAGSVVEGVGRAYLSSYNDYLASEYLIGEGIDPNDVFNIVLINTENINEEGEDFLSSFLVQIVLVYLVLIIIQTAQSTATDIIAGEKERGTLETLLTFPIKSNDIVAGKFLAIVTSCLITSMIGIVLTVPSFAIIKVACKSFADLDITISAITLILAAVILILTSCLAAGLCIALCGKAKSFKEAQSATAVLLVPTMFSMFTGFLGIKTNLLLSIIPIANSGILLNDLFFKGVNLPNIVAMFASTLIYIVVIIKYISSQYKSEKTLF